MTPRIFWVFFVGPEQLARFAVAFLRGTPDKSPDGSFTRSPIKNKRLLFLNQETPDENQVFFSNKNATHFCHCERASPTCVKRKAGRARRGNPVNKKAVRQSRTL